MKVGFRWNELPASFRVSSLIGLIGTAYQGLRVSPWTLIVLGLFAGPPGEGFSRLVLVTVALFGVPAASLAGAVSLLTLPMTEDHRGILAFFVMISSVIPVFFLAIDILSLIVPDWKLLVFAIPWLVLLAMGVRISRARSAQNI